MEVADTKVRVDGKVSEATTPVAVAGPLLVTTKLNLTVSPGLAVALSTVFKMLTSEEVGLLLPEEPTVVLAVEELLLGLESELVEEAVAVLIRVCPTIPVFTVALIVVVAEAPFSNVPIVHKLVLAI